MNTNDKLQKKLHLISFVVTALVIGYFAFVAVQLLAVHFLGIHTTTQPDNSGFYGHNYCGTFFIDITRDNSFADEASYLAGLQHTATPVKDILLNTSTVVMVLSLLIFLRRADKQTMHKKRTAWLLLLSGGLYALGNTVIEAANLFPQTEDFKGVMATQSYYPQLYAVYGIPLLVIAYGLILLHYEQTARRKSVVWTRVALKACVWVTGISAFGFMLWRFGVRCYELFSSTNARLPFYSVLLDLPRSEAVSEAAYTKLLLLRFVKDLPVFAASAIGVIVLIKLLYSAANGQINTTENRRRLKLAALTLAVSSVIFNLLGLAEVNMLNNSFTGIYGDVTYTIGIRSGCEPMLYAFILIAIEIYIQAIPQTEQ